jgi:hypothetical protein
VYIFIAFLGRKPEDGITPNIHRKAVRRRSKNNAIFAASLTGADFLHQLTRRFPRQSFQFPPGGCY